MNIDEIIKEKYPEFYLDSNIGYYIGPGWHHLIINLCDYVHRKLKWLSLKCKDNAVCLKPNTPPFEFKFFQIKEKFSTLRCYTSMINNHAILKDRFDENEASKTINRNISEIQGYIDCLERLSGSICEETGNKGYPCVKNGWEKTLCKEIIEKDGYKLLTE